MRTTVKLVAVCFIVSALVWFPRAAHLHGHTEHVTWAGISPDAKYIVSGSVDDKTVRIWEVATRKQLAVITKKERPISGVAFSLDCTLMASGDTDCLVTLWNLTDGKQRCQLSGHKSGVMSVVFSPDGKTLASWDKDVTVKVWDITTNKELFTFHPHHKHMTSIAYSPDGKLLACGGWVDGDSEIQLRDAKTGKELRSLKKPKWQVSKIVFSPDSARLCAADHCSLALWDVASGNERECENPKWLDNDEDHIRSLCFSPDGRTLAVGHSAAIGLWDVASGKNTITFTEDGERPYLRFSDRYFLDLEEQRPPQLTAAVFKPSGDLMVVGLRLKTVALWRLISVQLKK